MKCYSCGYETPIISHKSKKEELEFLDSFSDLDNHNIYPIVVCPKCRKIQ